MQPKPPPNYLAGYPAALTGQVQRLIEQGQLADMLLNKYPHTHEVRTDKALYDYVQECKALHLRNAGQLCRVAFDSRLHVIHNALGIHARISRVQGANLKTSREIRIAAVFKEMPPEFLRMIVVHELAQHRRKGREPAVLYRQEPFVHRRQQAYRRRDFCLVSGASEFPV